MSLALTLPEHGSLLVAGLDEAGRGPLAGEVVAAAVIPGPDLAALAINDSKKLSASCREQLCQRITEQAQSWGVGRASVAEIDRMNILQASLLAMQRAMEQLGQLPDLVYVDGIHLPRLSVPAHAVPRGDGLLLAVAAASIVAKVSRDRAMLELDVRHPGYGFARHKGYPTRDHLAALRRLGPCPEHRRSFGPVGRAARNE